MPAATLHPAPTADGAADVAAAASLAATAVAAALLIDPMLHLGEAGPAGALDLGAGARALVGTLVGGHGAGTLALAVGPELAEALEQGPLGHQSLAGALEPVLASACGALEAALGSPLRLEAPMLVDAAPALQRSIDLPVATTVALLAAGDVVGAVHVAWAADERAAAAAAALPVDLPSLGDPSASAGAGAGHPLELLHDVEMSVTAELGRTRMSVRSLLSLAPGSIVELDRAAGSPIDLLVNGTLIARGEVVVVDDEYGVRITEIVRREPPRR